MSDQRIAILLRAVNLGKHNKVPMAELRTLCGRLGLEGVSTYIASGNIICDAPEDVDVAVRELESGIEAQFGVATPAIARTHAELAAVLDANPYTAFEDRLMHVVYLADEPDPAGVAALAERDFGPDECTVVGREVYANYADGLHGSKLTPPVMQRLLGVPGTARNWRTAATLAELTA